MSEDVGSRRPSSEAADSGAVLDEDELTLEEIGQFLPIEKYQYLNKFPWRMVIELLLLFFTVYQINKLGSAINEYEAAQRRVWTSLFLPDAEFRDYSDMDLTQNQIEIYSLQHFKSHLSHVCEVGLPRGGISPRDIDL